MHREYRRLIPGAGKAVLLIHGIVGTPNHFRVLIPLVELIPPNWSVWNLCLPGHGGSVRDFGRSSMAQWRSYAKEAFLELADTHEKVILVGHSMGTLFALQLAAEYPEKVEKLFLMAVPLRPHVGIPIINSCLRLVFNRIREDHPMERSIVSACGTAPTNKLWRYIPWIPRFMELLAEIRITEKILKDICVSYMIFQSEKDELVSNRSGKILKKYGLGFVSLADSGHFHYAPEDGKQILQAFENIKKQA